MLGQPVVALFLRDDDGGHCAELESLFDPLVLVHVDDVSASNLPTVEEVRFGALTLEDVDVPAGRKVLQELFVVHAVGAGHHSRFAREYVLGVAYVDALQRETVFVWLVRQPLDPVHA